MMEILWNDLIVFNEGLFVSLFLNNFIIFNMIYMYIKWQWGLMIYINIKFNFVNRKYNNIYCILGYFVNCEWVMILEFLKFILMLC